ncbi:Mannitol-specific cryptic phosphotransferase enzyme IIA component [Vibrio nigripulchritudo MADA3029]|uniref:PTS sugar transporter subunit IIA n=1 Tax=Vibrio nigripulchritudo TaxID=28173 RepID=UPI0003B1E372|nr:PTS sugar transporter subunit IIA [Vibrio nigripulchritudo]CCN46074.1 Mannitol-specific cryptic phosphotransferase enzyme IIA component [Vibrio nigripulchritudo MADA3020]CCN53992.1 Mannitol-specific cryptic phosphotransferase enzyme IIA component [Vibrio nigripulchritudo MADA3021]CCN60646.1 Mannitol-specific cryptic phosphotransferase enzyme IIA component [Vibrio nigripulchritudo MADA3029]BDU41185.1 PTS beta-glucoside transporter subunit IIABC [Vibrio nigripulchritudo]BDU46950.1 PTS beta-gl
MSIYSLIGESGIVISTEEQLSVDEALNITCSTLIERGKIEQSYLDAIKNKHKEIGSYYVLAPKIAMPHARPENGVNEACLQVTVFKNGVDLESEDNGDVYFSVTLAATDSDSHIQTIVALSELFQNEDDINAIIHSNNKEDIISILKKY